MLQREKAWGTSSLETACDGSVCYLARQMGKYLEYLVEYRKHNEVLGLKNYERKMLNEHW